MTKIKCFALILTASTAALISTACQQTANTNVAVNIPANTNTATANANAAPPANTNTGKAVGSLATPTDAYKTAYVLRKNRDAAGLKKVLSKDILEFFTEVGKAENKSLDDMLKDLAEKPQGPSDEVRNEKITGDRAILEYKNEKGEWKEMDFVKEDGEWKLTLPEGNGPDDKGPTKK